jgi:Tol biopolymer transport system component
VLYISAWPLRDLRKFPAAPGLVSSPAWSPDGKKVAFVVTHHTESSVWLGNVTTMKAHEIAQAGP